MIPIATLIALPLLAASGWTHEGTAAIPWNARTVEHLYNRAAFGANAAEIAEGVRLGPEALVDELLRKKVEWNDIAPELFRWEDFGFDHRQLPLVGSPFAALASQLQVQMCKDGRLVDREQFLAVEGRWLELCAANGAPVRDRMTLFWHSLFTTSLVVNKRKYELMRQFQWLRRSALSSYAELLHGIVRDPAMLQYYDNTGNFKEHPNENFARELMELYSLGEGNYTEVDVREAARALTGWAGTSDGRFEILAERHDDGEKTILGRTGTFDGDALVDILLEQPACARYVTARLLRYFEGVAPTDARRDEYAALLRDAGWRIEPFLRRLFTDPAFYRAEAMGARVSSPIEFHAVVCHKLDYVPPIPFSHEATRTMGQSFYAPPSVKGWPEGLGWMASDAIFRRGNFVAIMVGALESETALARVETVAADCADGLAPSPDGDDEELPAMIASARSASGRPLEYERLHDHIAGRWWRPSEKLLPALDRLGARTDEAIVDHVVEEWLAIEPPQGLREMLLLYVSAQRDQRRVGDDSLLDHPEDFDFVLRHLAQVVFSLPEAQLL